MVTAGLNLKKHTRNIHTSSFYHLTAAAEVDARMEKAKGTVDFSNCDWLKNRGDAIVKVWGGSKTEDFVWKGV